MDRNPYPANTEALTSEASNCFVCGPNNPEGLQLTFKLVDEYCISSFTPQPHHCGFEGVTHGGIIFSVLDDVMANWLFLRGQRAVTAKCDLRYKTPLAISTAVDVKSWCIKQRGTMAILGAEMRQAENQIIVAHCEATFMITSQ